MRLYKSNGYIVFIGILFLFLGASCILYSITHYGEYIEQISTYEQSYGTIIDIYEQRQYKDEYNMEELTICKFRYMVEDELYINENVVNKNQYEVGNNIVVYYTDKNPEKGFIIKDNLLLYMIVGILGLIGFGSGVGITLIGLSAKEVIVFQQNNNLEINMDNFNNEEWNNKLKEIRLHELNNNQRVMSSFQQSGEYNQEEKYYDDKNFENMETENINDNDYYGEFY